MTIARALALTLLLASSAAQAQSAPVRAENAWSRGTPPGADVGAVYLTLTASVADQLVGVSSPAAARAELHEVNMQGGVMQMRATAGVMLPAGQPIALAPGSYHIMLVGLKQPLRPGQSVPLHLTFAKAPPGLDKFAYLNRTRALSGSPRCSFSRWRA
jgi:copper(I)-binding protein